MKKVSFDFDNTLEFQSIQNYAKKLIEEGIEVHIVTSRYEDLSKYSFECDHEDMFEVVNKLGIKKENIHFTNMEYKWRFFIKNPDFIWHLDDNGEEIQLFHIHKVKTKCIWSLSGNYEYDCNDLLNLQHLNK